MTSAINDIEQSLGFSGIRELLKEFCLFEPGRELTNQMKWETDPALVVCSLGLDEEFLEILQGPAAFPVSNYYDPRVSIGKLKPQGTFLEEDEVWEIYLFLKTCDEIDKFLMVSKEDWPTLNSLRLENYPRTLIKAIQLKFDETGKLRDNASPELNKIRKRKKEVEGSLGKVINRIYQEASLNGFVPKEMSVSVRGGRVVIPISSEHKRKIRGIIHDYSATGSIVFIEPDSILEITNQVQNLQHQEKIEIIKILLKISDEIRAEAGFLLKAVQFLATIDFTRSKALFAKKIGAVKPAVDLHEPMKIVNGRHPLLLLQNKEAVPLNLVIDKKERIVMISGPNAGGKSVALKTVGLFQYMLQCGLLVPAEETSSFKIFNKIFLDIGDQQSLENDLSTYSSHLKNMSEILANADEKSLILIDEFGSGTDPQIGGAIAEAILEGIIQRKCWGLITTHYSNLKHFAEKSEYLSNAAMLFDKQNLRPFYILEQGRQGGSFALEVAQKTGLPEEIIARAKELAGSEAVSLEDILARLDQERKELSNRLLQLDKSEREAALNKEMYLQLKKEIEGEQRELINDASMKAETLLNEANREIEKTIRHIKENKAEKKETRKIRNQLDEFRDKVKVEPEKSGEFPGKDFFCLNDTVEINKEGMVGEILEIRGKEALVLVGNIKTKVKLKDLRKTDAKPLTPRPASGYQFERKVQQLSTSLDVRGLRAEEVIFQVDKFLDNALVGGINQVSVIHGKGNGILRKVIREHIKRLSHIQKFENEHLERGGDGVTVIYLK
ncbi:MAG TPA: endonuclease MutS2 [Cyclobacteriaceae bacterium]